MYQLAATQTTPLCAPHLMLQIFTQLQALQAESSTIWKHCNVTIADLTKQVHKCHRERKRWREMEQELMEEKDTLHLKLLNALEKNTELEGFLWQQKEYAGLFFNKSKQLEENLQKVQNEVNHTSEELNKYKDIAHTKEQEAKKSNKYVQEMLQELNASREQRELCNILADIAIGSEENEYSVKALAANSTVLKLWQATETVKNCKNIKNEMNTTSTKLEVVVNERDQLKKVLQEKESSLTRMTEEKTTMSEEINTKQNKITTLSEENQHLQGQLQEEKTKISILQQQLEEQKQKCSNAKETQNILGGRTYNEALLDAATRGNVREIEVLLDAGANIEATDDKKRTPLILAAMKGHIEACKFLLNRGANLGARATGWYNNTPFLAAVIYSNNLDAVKFLADAGADMYARDSLNSNAFQKDAINESIKQWLKTKGKQ